MELIKPRQISGDIMTLIEEADETVIIITPYFKVRNWNKMINSLNSLKARKIKVEIYVRENEFETINEVRSIGFEPITIPNLHANLYLNEKIGIVSSMNILYSSDANSLDIAVKTENENEYKALWDFYLRHIKGNNSVISANNFDWKMNLEAQLAKSLNREPYINESANCLEINTGNRYEVFIKRTSTNELHVVGILSKKEFDYASRSTLKLKHPKMKTVLKEGNNKNYDTIIGVMGNLKSFTIDKPLVEESKSIVDGIVEFIIEVENLKRLIR